jgi:hypothetical protein
MLEAIDILKGVSNTNVYLVIRFNLATVRFLDLRKYPPRFPIRFSGKTATHLPLYLPEHDERNPPSRKPK